MKLQGVIILRITDFQRFFDLDEFLVKKHEFIELMKQFGTRAFCDNAKQRDLCGVLRNWINGDPITAEIKNGMFTISGANGSSSFALGVLENQINKYHDKLGFKDLYGLTALYLLAGANEKNCSFTPDYGIFVNERKGITADNNFISLHKDTELPPAGKEYQGNFRVCTLANINAGGPVNITVGNERATLHEGECITAIFSDNGCVTLLNREASALPGLYAVLVPDKTHKRANLKISSEGHTEIIAGVTSVWIEPGAGVAYVTDSGEVVYNANKCYLLKNRMSIFYKYANGQKILSVTKSDNGNYVIYTDTQIHH